MEFFDTHMHIDDEKFDIDREDVIEKIFKAGVTTAIDVGCDIETSKKAIELAQNNEFIYAICGLHPSEIPQSEDELWKTISKIKDLVLNNKKIVGIGEIGLDYYWDKSFIDIQQEVLRLQIELAKEIKKKVEEAHQKIEKSKDFRLKKFFNLLNKPIEKIVYKYYMNKYKLYSY